MITRHSREGGNPGFKHFVKRRFTAWISAFAGMTMLVTGCKVEPPKPPLVETVAILPFDNESNDINAPEMMQSLVYWALRPSPYRLLDIKTVNEKLATVGIVDGGQLPALNPMKIATDFGVQALLYGYITDFGYVNVGFYVSRKVGLELKMVDGKTGQTLWENSGSVALRNFTLDQNEAGKQLAKGLAEQFVEKLFNSPLEGEAKQATIKALRTLPGFVFTRFDNDRPKGAAVKDVIQNQIRRK